MARVAGASRTRDAAGTRRRRLEAAAAEIYGRGYHAASLDQVLRAAGMTKGALYHHFQSKQELALAVVREILGGHVQGFVSELAQAPDPIRALREWVE